MCSQTPPTLGKMETHLYFLETHLFILEIHLFWRKPTFCWKPALLGVDVRTCKNANRTVLGCPIFIKHGNTECLAAVEKTISKWSPNNQNISSGMLGIHQNVSHWKQIILHGSFHFHMTFDHSLMSEMNKENIKQITNFSFQFPFSFNSRNVCYASLLSLEIFSQRNVDSRKCVHAQYIFARFTSRYSICFEVLICNTTHFFLKLGLWLCWVCAGILPLCEKGE